MIIHKTFSDFILFLYVHASQSDNHYDPTEMTVIKTKMTSLFPSGTNLEKKLYGAIREYNTFDKTKLDDLFSASINHFKSEGLVKDNTLFTDMEDIIRADGKVNSSETKALEFITRLITAAGVE